MPRRQPRPAGTRSSDRWVVVAGLVVGAVTLVFLGLLVAAALLGYPLPSESRFLVIAFLSLGAALSSAFIGGTAAARGRIPIPLLQRNPLRFSVAGGAAVLVIVMSLGNVFFPTSTGPVKSKSPAPGRYDCTADAAALPKCQVSGTEGQGLAISFSIPESSSELIDTFRGSMNSADDCFSATLVNSFENEGRKTEGLGGSLDHVCQSRMSTAKWEGIWRSDSGRTKVFTMIRTDTR